MAHFARIEDGIVRQVIVVNNEVLKDENGQEQELIGIAFCKSLYGQDTEWLQTSYNGSFRGKYAGSGDKYDPIKDEFVSPITEE
jgi:hypothetical protein